MGRELRQRAEYQQDQEAGISMVWREEQGDAQHGAEYAFGRKQSSSIFQE